jgi:hypothetical protein
MRRCAQGRSPQRGLWLPFATTQGGLSSLGASAVRSAATLPCPAPRWPFQQTGCIIACCLTSARSIARQTRNRTNRTRSELAAAEGGTVGVPRAFGSGAPQAACALPPGSAIASVRFLPPVLSPPISPLNTSPRTDLAAALWHEPASPTTAHEAVGGSSARPKALFCFLVV